jgi:hypothetical protein
MAPNPRNLAGGLWVPRWLALLLASAALLYLGLRILVPPAWNVQRLDSPDGRRSARLLRTRYAAHESLVVKAKEGWTWRTLFYSAPLPIDYRVDIGERLFWSEDSRRLFLKLEGHPVWGYDFGARRRLAPDEL